MPRIDDEIGFRQFASNLEVALQKYPEPDESLLEVQRRQIRTLVDLEDRFRKTLIDHPWGAGVYRDFIKFIHSRKTGILAARPYFRERQTTFTSYISGVLKRNRDRELYRFHFNWSFVHFVLGCRRWPAGGKIAVLAKKINGLRQELLEQNLPLAISQARIFWSNTPRSHLSYMDIVQIQCQGLLLAIDKFVPPNEKKRKLSNRKSLEAYRKFRAVAIGIMARDRVNQYSETLIHFYPVDKLLLYRAHKAVRRFAGEVNHEKLAEIVNTDLKADQKTDAFELADLMASASTVSADFAPDPDSESVVSSYAADDNSRPDLIVEEHEASGSMKVAARSLRLRERKMLKLKGVQL